MPRSFYTVLFLSNVSGNREVSRSFDRLANARKWAKSVNSKAYVAETFIYQGGPGGLLVA
jgi:hypothetical protein